MVLGEDLREPLARQREELVAPGGEAGADGHADIHHDHKQRAERAEDRQRDLHALVLDEHAGAGGLAGERCGGLGLEIVFLHGEHGQRDEQQHDGHRRCSGLVVGAGDLQIDRRGQRVIGTADDHGVGKVGDRLDKGHEEGVAQTGQHQRQRHVREHLPAARAHIAGGLLQRGVDIFQQALEHHIADREEGQRLDDDDAPVAIDAVVVYVQQKAGDDARLAEEHDHGQGQHEGRGHDRQHRDDLEQASRKFVQPDVDLNVSEEQADQRGENADDKAYLERVCNGAGKARHGKDAFEDGQTEAAVAHKAVHQQDRQRVEDKEGQKSDQHDDGGDHDGVGHQFFPVQRRALASCHRIRPFQICLKKDGGNYPPSLRLSRKAERDHEVLKRSSPVSAPALASAVMTSSM